VAHSFDGYMRVRPGTTDEQLRNTLEIVAQGFGRDYPGPETNRALSSRRSSMPWWAI
jgi:hypothetical protein